MKPSIIEEAPPLGLYEHRNGQRVFVVSVSLDLASLETMVGYVWQGPLPRLERCAPWRLFREVCTLVVRSS